MQDTDREHDRASNQEAPRPRGKAGEDMREPRQQTTDTNNPAHDLPLQLSK
jgi:hypothetical protein